MVLPVDLGWNDVGSWSAPWEVSAQDGDGNARHGDVIAVDSHNSYAYARRLAALVGADDPVVVEPADAVLSARKDRPEARRAGIALVSNGNIRGEPFPTTNIHDQTRKQTNK